MFVGKHSQGYSLLCVSHRQLESEMSQVIWLWSLYRCSLSPRSCFSTCCSLQRLYFTSLLLQHTLIIRWPSPQCLVSVMHSYNVIQFIVVKQGEIALCSYRMKWLSVTFEQRYSLITCGWVRAHGHDEQCEPSARGFPSEMVPRVFGCHCAE